MKPYIIVTFYKFIPLDLYESMKEPLLSCMKKNQVTGTMILASEGINGSFCGTREEITPLIDFMHSYPQIADLAFRESYHESNPFKKAKVKLRKEIVTMGVANIDPNHLPGTHLNAEEWNALINDPEVVLIDTRNDYEFALGTFKAAINPVTENFRDFPEYVEEHLSDKKDKKIAMFCTGGIRCEKSTAYLRTIGFKEVYQLNGGILGYLEAMPEEKSLWEGSCFVFDDRVALDHQLNGYPAGTIDSEWKNNHKKKNREI